jgi:Cu(I)-responsive transcriptional regulator
VTARINGLTIGRVARQAGLAIDTVRYYEREGLLEKAPRTRAGYRQYSASAVARLRFIRQAKELGFSLREIRELLALRVDARKTCRDVKRRALQKISDVERRIAQLERMRRALAALAAQCTGDGPTSTCPILEALEHEERS